MLSLSDQASNASTRWCFRAARLLRLDEPLHRCVVSCAQAAGGTGLVAQRGGADRDRRLCAPLVERLTNVRGRTGPWFAHCIAFLKLLSHLLDIGNPVR